ncbi:family 33 glycosyltransferase [Plectosphaerella cucumerina]|uniref:Chitobiosyldiphosphodolichol beta-mannosyltransferase n=1 Tax=Plectosphaerella cucumerina TaxID=40658 RepID=A0A8K0T7P6_9PEZI|nr:family 33 glycosyltransferase [Plectosphaerella cucumerina]
MASSLLLIFGGLSLITLIDILMIALLFLFIPSSLGLGLAVWLAALAVAAAVSSLLSIVGCLLVIKLFISSERPAQDHHQILVLGDIGRSPRMQYHALSIAKHGGHVDIIGYNESPLIPQLQNHKLVKIYPLAPLPLGRDSGLPFVLLGPLKVLWQSWHLFRLMALDTPTPRWIVIQNPPSIPTLHTALLVSLYRSSHILLDWHNFGSTILATTRSPSDPFVFAYRLYETTFGALAPTANLTVTDAMAKVLRKDPYSVSSPILTLHDRPASIFKPFDKAQRKKALNSIAETKASAEAILKGGLCLIVSSTSWTPDEDFGILLEALVSYSGTLLNEPSRKPILAIITGKGPQKDTYLARIKYLTDRGLLPGVQIVSAWLTTEQYAALLASADLGICLHKSSSGVDLPMKVVDMFGSGLPVAAYSKYESFGELVKEGVNGCGFVEADELADILVRLLGDSGAEELQRLKRGAVEEGSLRWDEEWDRVVGRVLGLIDP